MAVLRIDRAALGEHGGAIGAGAANARRRWSRRRGLLLTLHDGEGAAGVGEASPLPGYSSDRFDAVRAALAAWCAAPPDLDLEAPIAAQVAAAVAAVDGRLPAARCAVESALLDLAGRRLGVPVHALLGAGERPPPVPLAALVPGAPEAAAAAVNEALERGLATVKLKLGAPGAWSAELASLAAVRAAGGGRLAIRLDANGSLPPAAAAARLAALAAFEPVWIEEPVAARELLDLALAPASPPVPLALDETLQRSDGEAIAERLAAAGRLRAVALKPMALGGALACLALARALAPAGVGAYVSHLFDGPVARAACAHLALALPGARLAAGLDRHPGLDAWPPADTPIFQDAAVVADRRPGLGLTVAW